MNIALHMNNDPVCALDEIHTRNSGVSLYMTKSVKRLSEGVLSLFTAALLANRVHTRHG